MGDGRSVISRIAINLVGRDLAFDFIRDKWDRVVDYYGSLSFAMAGLMKNVLSQRNTEFSLNEIETFYEKIQTHCPLLSVKSNKPLKELAATSNGWKIITKSSMPGYRSKNNEKKKQEQKLEQKPENKQR